MRLGEYLMAKGRVTRNEVDAARQMQRVNNHLMGVLAVDRGYMTCDQLEDVVYRQSKVPHQLFGEIATEYDYLSRAQVEMLLQVQDGNRLRIGEVLILQSRITEQELIDELRAFKEYNQALHRKTA